MFKIYNEYYIIFCMYLYNFYMYVLKLSYIIKVNLYLLYSFFDFLCNIKKTNLNLTNLKEISVLTKID